METPHERDEIESLGPQEIIREALMLGLRTKEGVDLHETAQRADAEPEAGREDALRLAEERGDIVRAGSRIRVPQTRWLKLDGIVRDLF